MKCAMAMLVVGLAGSSACARAGPVTQVQDEAAVLAVVQQFFAMIRCQYDQPIAHCVAVCVAHGEYSSCPRSLAFRDAR